MDSRLFVEALEANVDTIERIRIDAHRLHDSVGQTYDRTHPYWFHLDNVAALTRQYGHEVCESPDDVIAIMMGAYFHDSIEDARLTYNNVLRIASSYMNESKALMAAEIVYALTNEKGRTRAERANEKYYEGIRSTPYAPLVKLADRLANMKYSISQSMICNNKMASVYSSELPHFLASITNEASSDRRLSLPHAMVEEIKALIH